MMCDGPPRPISQLKKKTTKVRRPPRGAHRIPTDVSSEYPPVMTNIKIDFKGKPKVSAEFGKPKSSSITAKAGAKTQGLPSAKYSRASS